MLTASDVMRMTEQKDVDGLIRVLQSDSDSHVRSQAATALGLLGDPKAKAALQNALQNTLLNNDFKVSGAASGALGVLEAKIAGGAGIQEKQVDKITKKEQEGFRGILWKAIFLIGFLPLSIGLLAGIAIFDSSSTIEWLSALFGTGFLVGFGLLLIYLSTRPIKPKEPTEN